MQGLTVGALVGGLRITNRHYTGGEFGWFSPFAVLCGVGLCLGYALLVLVGSSRNVKPMFAMRSIT
jgi:cytochrome d ubiquinol oxidase subunit II